MSLCRYIAFDFFHKIIETIETIDYNFLKIIYL